jgi:hypothetical protein
MIIDTSRAVRKLKRNTRVDVRLCRIESCAIYSRGMQASIWNARKTRNA